MTAHIFIKTRGHLTMFGKYLIGLEFSISYPSSNLCCE